MASRPSLIAQGQLKLSDEPSFNPLFLDAMADLMACFEAFKPSQVILESTITVVKESIKLCCWVGDVESAIGTARVPPGFYASDLFVELLTAVRALDWEVVVILLEQAAAPIGSTSIAVGPR
jgi:hypothetical protein